MLLPVFANLQAGDFFIPVEVPENRILNDYIQRVEFENAPSHFNTQLTPIFDYNQFPNSMIFGKTKPGRFQLSPFHLQSIQ